MTNSSYTTDLTDDQWQIIQDLLPPAKRGGRPRTVCLRQSLNAMFYLPTTFSPRIASGSLIPKSYRHFRTVYGYFRAFPDDGTWRRIHNRLRRYARRLAGRTRPTAASVDSQCVKATQMAGVRGYDAFKSVKGRKRHIIVDTLGLLLAVAVTPARQKGFALLPRRWGWNASSPGSRAADVGPRV